ncbi:MAG: hypothetical protein MUO54_14210 [Anaerolineales bacterium]|nr:hypothetical protein [Anaerolineales bacterium]
MKAFLKLLILIFIAAILSSCGAIPTLPPMDSTITIRTPIVTVMHLQSSSTSVVVDPTEVHHSQTPVVTETSLPATKTPYLSPTNPPVTATSTSIPNSPTPRNTSTPTSTSTPPATATATATFTSTPTYTVTPVPFTLQVMNPFYLRNFAHEDLGCNWLGVAGQIFDSGGQVQKDIIIKAGGDINGNKVVEDMTMPLSNPGIDQAYGPGGFELTLGTAPADTDLTAWVQLYNLAGDPISERIYLVTYNDCQKNLILMNFIEK